MKMVKIELAVLKVLLELIYDDVTNVRQREFGHFLKDAWAVANRAGSLAGDAPEPNPQADALKQHIRNLLTAQNKCPICGAWDHVWWEGLARSALPKLRHRAAGSGSSLGELFNYRGEPYHVAA
jgi:hypothetical protein